MPREFPGESAFRLARTGRLAENRGVKRTLPRTSAIVLDTLPDAALTAFAPPRARGKVRLSAKRRGPGSVLDTLHQSGSLKALFPRRAGPDLQAVLVNTAGGITGGDRLAAVLCAGEDTTLTVTTQAAERAYRAPDDLAGRLETRLHVADDARLNWLPQETILFRGCRYDRSLVADLAPGARLLLTEPVVFGRTAMGERMCDGWFRDRIELRRGGLPLYLDAMTFAGDIAGRLARPATGGGAGAMALVLYVGPDAEAHLPHLRAGLPATAGASLVREDVLALRILAPDGHLLRAALVPVLTRLGGGPLPRPWML